MQKIGTAISLVNANNTHSGNLSVRDPSDPDLFYITASGSQGGHLIKQDIVPINFSGVSWGDARGSTESTIHREILKIPQVNSVIHAHYMHSTFISFDTKDKQLFLRFSGTDNRQREEFLFYPVDLIGAYAIGGVKVGSYEQPVGSSEMEERIPQYLSKGILTIVRGHGPFARGSSPENAFHYLSVLENSSKLAIFLRRRGIDIGRIQKAIIDLGNDKFFPANPNIPEISDSPECKISDPSILEDFRIRLNYNYRQSIGAYGTGSMSHKISSRKMIFCSMSAVPENFEFPLYRTTISFQEDDTLDLRLHKLIYQNTHQNSCMITSSPLATAEGMAILAEHYGMEVLSDSEIKIPYLAENHPVVKPIDGEAIYLNPRVGLVDLSQLTDMTPHNPILNMLRWYKGCCIVAGYGVISTGETTLEQAAHNASSAERIARFRSEVFINEKMIDGPAVAEFEPK
ncbi:MAG: class II aldolase/adducin family protein [bacterium]|nr:class II aldolase/adducin family protein [bacterium]